MDRFTKINEINNLKSAINKQKHLVEEELRRLHTLEGAYAKTTLIELPILLFTLKDLKGDNIYVYYYADLNKVDFISKENEILPNAIDLRNTFNSLNMPTVISSDNAVESSEKIDYAVNLLASKIDELFSQYDIKSWQELGIYLQSLKEEEFNLESYRHSEGPQPK